MINARQEQHLSNKQADDQVLVDRIPLSLEGSVTKWQIQMVYKIISMKNVYYGYFCPHPRTPPSHRQQRQQHASVCRMQTELN